MIGYLIARQGQPLPPCHGLFQYILAANGVFIRAAKPGLNVQLKIGHTLTDLRGLESLAESVEVERIPQAVLETILQLAHDALPNEILFYLKPVSGGWQIDLPEQAMSPGSVRPLDPNDPACAQALCELHSHNTLPAFFSATDDAEESFGFRIYAVIGRVDTAPEIRVRVGVYGHLLEIPPEWVFDLPDAFLRPAPEYSFPSGDENER